MPQPQQIRMKIAKPTNFDQADEIVMQLKEKNAVVINLEYVSKDVARRIVDVVSGAVKALDGNIEKVSNSIFVVAPYNYDIINEIINRAKAVKLTGSDNPIFGNKNAINGIINVVALGSSFLCGTFVPVEFLPNRVFFIFIASYELGILSTAK